MTCLRGIGTRLLPHCLAQAYLQSLSCRHTSSLQPPVCSLPNACPLCCSCTCIYVPLLVLPHILPRKCSCSFAQGATAPRGSGRRLTSLVSLERISHVPLTRPRGSRDQWQTRAGCRRACLSLSIRFQRPLSNRCLLCCACFAVRTWLRVLCCAYFAAGAPLGVQPYADDWCGE